MSLASPGPRPDPFGTRCQTSARPIRTCVPGSIRMASPRPVMDRAGQCPDPLRASALEARASLASAASTSPPFRFDVPVALARDWSHWPRRRHARRPRLAAPARRAGAPRSSRPTGAPSASQRGPLPTDPNARRLHPTRPTAGPRHGRPEPPEPSPVRHPPRRAQRRPPTRAIRPLEAPPRGTRRYEPPVPLAFPPPPAQYIAPYRTPPPRHARAHLPSAERLPGMPDRRPALRERATHVHLTTRAVSGSATTLGRARAPT